jgi:hypothetical protein
MLVLDDEDPGLAAQLFQEVLDIRDITTMLVFGTGPDAQRAATLADQLSFRGLLGDGSSFRRVIWVLDATALSQVDSLRELFAAIVAQADGLLPLAAVLDTKDRVRGAIKAGSRFDALELEKLFLQGDAT